MVEIITPTIINIFPTKVGPLSSFDIIFESLFLELFTTVSAMSSCVVQHLISQVHTKLKILQDFQKQTRTSNYLQPLLATGFILFLCLSTIFPTDLVMFLQCQEGQMVYIIFQLNRCEGQSRFCLLIDKQVFQVPSYNQLLKIHLD